MKKLKWILIAITASITFINNANAQWYGEFPFIIDPTCIAISGNNVFVGTATGVFRSTDNGTFWRTVNNGMPAYTSTLSLAISGTNILAGTNNGVFFSADSGKTWVAANNGITGYAVESFAVNGNDIFAGSDSGVFLSTNGGKSWASVSSGLPVTTVNTLAISGNNIFAGTEDNFGFGGIFRSSDNGKTWKAIDSGLTYVSAGTGLTDTAAIYSIAMVGNTIFAAAGTNGMYSSSDSGKSWTHFNISIWSISSLTVSGTNIFAGMGSGGGVYQSADTGKSWTSASYGLINTEANILSLGASGNTIYAGTEGGLVVSRDKANTWSVDDTDNGLRVPEINALTTCGGKIFAGGYGYTVYISTDKGKSWASENTPSPSSGINSLAANGATILAGTSLGGGTNGVLLSKDSGKTWAAASNGLPTSTGTTNSFITSFAFRGSNIFMGARSVTIPLSGGVYLSTDTGNSWTAVNNGLTGYNFVNALTVLGNNVFAGTDSGIFLSTNNGNSWKAMDSGLIGHIISAFAIYGSKIFVSTNDPFSIYGGGRVYISKDTGKTWAMVNFAFPELVSSFAINGGEIFAGARGVFLSRDSGSTWTDVSEGLTDYYFSSLAINGNYIYAGGSGDYAGVNFRPLSDFNCNPSKPKISANGPSKFCQGGSVILTSSIANTYLWSTGDTSKSIVVSTNGKDSVKITDNIGCPAISSAITITVNPLPATPTINQIGDTLISSAKAGNQWMLNDTLIKGATNQKLSASLSGKYGVIITDNNGCTASFDSMFTIVNTGVDKSTLTDFRVNIYPNPFTNMVNIDATLSNNRPVNITIFDMTGRLVEMRNVDCGLRNGGNGNLNYIFDAAQHGGNNNMFIVKISAGNEVVEKQIVRIKE